MCASESILAVGETSLDTQSRFVTPKKECVLVFFGYTNVFSIKVSIETSTDQLRYNEPQCSEPFRTTNAFYTPDAIGSGHMNLNTTNRCT